MDIAMLAEALFAVVVAAAAAIVAALMVFALPVAALLRLKGQPFSDRDFIFWAAMVVLFPVLGSITVLIAFPKWPRKPK